MNTTKAKEVKSRLREVIRMNCYYHPVANEPLWKALESFFESELLLAHQAGREETIKEMLETPWIEAEGVWNKEDIAAWAQYRGITVNNIKNIK